MAIETTGRPSFGYTVAKDNGKFIAQRSRTAVIHPKQTRQQPINGKYDS